MGSIIYPLLSLHLINLSAEMFPFLAHILEPFLYNQANVCFLLKCEPSFLSLLLFLQGSFLFPVLELSLHLSNV